MMIAEEVDNSGSKNEEEELKLSAVKLADLLKEVTKVVDVTKGTLQLQMLIFLNEHGPQTADQISKELGKRRKAVTDALRKLKLKEVVKEFQQTDERGESAVVYGLTDNGKEYVNSLKGIFSQKGASAITTSRETGFRLIELIEEIPLLFNTYDAIIAIGLSGNKGVTAKNLASLFGLSEQRAITYLDLFTDAKGATLFKKKVALPNERDDEIKYVLSDNGMRILKLLPTYSSLQTSYTFKILMKLTRSVHPRQVYVRTAIILAIGSVLTIADRMIVPQIPAFTIAWIIFLAILAGLLFVDRVSVRVRE
jgi:DNA-binding MarR family transcriptional regulator